MHKEASQNYNLVYSEPIAPYFDADAKAGWEDITSDMLSDHYLMRFDHKKRLYLHSDFSAISSGYAATQPDDNKESIAAMHREMVGGLCEFMAKGAKLTLRPAAFGSR